MTHSRFFTRTLLEWHHNDNDRELPWKNERNPYKIWLSEVILQQTTAQQGKKYYDRFITHYPHISILAEAADEEVYKLWEGLGYYSRCKNLLKTARIISTEYDNRFPDNYDDIIRLPGIGPYTAAAITSFAYNQVHAVVDGNVYRVLARYFGIFTAIDTTEGKKIFQKQAQELISHSEPAHYNQAIMDFGATICTPKNPKCSDCPFTTHCYKSIHEVKDTELPLKKNKIIKQTRHFNYFIIEDSKGNIYFEQRTADDIWQNLYQPFLIETEKDIDNTEFLFTEISKNFSIINFKKSDLTYIGTHRQVLTHRVIESKWYHIKSSHRVESTSDKGLFYSKINLKKLAFPQTIFSFISKNPYF